ncbi:MAG: nucleoside hydrolase [Pseudomonadota bacterium]
MKVIFDTDPGIDDAMAILFAHYAEGIDLLGLTTVFGNASVAQTTRNAVLLRERFELNCAVHRGAAQGLCIPADPPPTFVHGDDGLGNTGCDTDASADAGNAVQYIIDTVRAHPGEVTIVAVGRMTNLAMALAIDPDIARLTREVVIMGGVTGYNGFRGNVTPVAEANIIGDPHAADAIMQAPWKVTMVGLDVTMKVLVTPAEMQQLNDQGGAAGEFLYAITRHYQAFYEGRSGSDSFPMHDSMALMYLLKPELFSVAEGPIRVVTEGPAVGQTLFAPRPRVYEEIDWATTRPLHNVCADVDANAAKAVYFETLLNAAG